MESEDQPEFEPSFHASVKGDNWRSETYRHHKVTLTRDQIRIGDRSTTTDIALDDIRRIDVVVLTIEPYWFLANSVIFLPLMNDRPMLRLTVGKDRRVIELRPEMRDLAYSTFVQLLTGKALTGTPRIKIATGTAPRSELL